MTVFTEFDDIIKSKRKYSIIYADPPWEYADKALAGKRGAGCKMNEMSLEDICSLPVGRIASDDSVLLSWGTWPHYNAVTTVIDRWGFTFKTCAFVWVKRYLTGTIFKGMGSWTRSNTEFVLLATKGKPKRINAGITQVIESTPTEFLRKPDIVRTRILELVGELPRIELFGRTPIHGWDVFGDDPRLADTPLETFF